MSFLMSSNKIRSQTKVLCCLMTSDFVSVLDIFDKNSGNSLLDMFVWLFGDFVQTDKVHTTFSII